MNKDQIEKKDHSHLLDKVKLRINHLPKKGTITVLDAFAGKGTIWARIKRKTDKDIRGVGIDKNPPREGKAQLQGDNIKFIPPMDLSAYDVIDLDAYGIPYRILKQIFSNGTAKTGTAVFVTFIQSVQGRLPTEMLVDLGYTAEMIKKAPALLCRNGFEKFMQVLAHRGVKSISYIAHNRKYYIYFKMQ